MIEMYVPVTVAKAFTVNDRKVQTLLKYCMYIALMLFVIIDRSILIIHVLTVSIMKYLHVQRT